MAIQNQGPFFKEEEKGPGNKVIYKLADFDVYLIHVAASFVLILTSTLKVIYLISAFYFQAYFIGCVWSCYKILVNFRVKQATNAFMFHIQSDEHEVNFVTLYY